MIEAIGEVIECTPASHGEFDADKFRQSHLLRQIQIIGEAASRLSANIRDLHPEVPWRSMAGVRHVLVHGYYEVNWARVYETASRDVPAIRSSIEAILASLPA